MTQSGRQAFIQPAVRFSFPLPNEANPADPSMFAMDDWDSAHLNDQEAATKTEIAREASKDGLRSINYGI